MSGTNALLADFVRTGSEQAFRELVTGYLNLVFSTAVRLLDGEKRLAEDVSQHVFIDLARKAVELPEDVQLGGWLYCHTCFLARKTRRRERRRRVRELRAVEMLSLADFTEENLRNVGFVLDEAINELKVEDRTAILLRFFEQLDIFSIGTQMDCSEDAARMRVARAVEKLGTSLRRRGVTLSAAGLIFVLTTKITSAAPIALAAHISHAAIVTASKSGLSLALLKELCLTRLNIGLVSASVAVVITLMLFLPRDPKPNLESSSQSRRDSSIAKVNLPTDSKSSLGQLPGQVGTAGNSRPGPYDSFLASLVSAQPKNYDSVSNLLSLAIASGSYSNLFPETWSSNAASINVPGEDRRGLENALNSVLDSVKSIDQAVADDDPGSTIH